VSTRDARPLIVVPDDNPACVAASPDLLAQLRDLGEVRVNNARPTTEAAVLDVVRDAHTVINVRASTPLTAPVLSQCPALRHISVHGIGTDNIDLDAARRLGITVSNIPGYSAPTGPRRRWH
jgi:phosphoglycerate dehydrogenase-like enzyme